MADLDDFPSTSEQRLAERVAASDQGFGDSPALPADESIDKMVEEMPPDIEPVQVHAIQKDLKTSEPVQATVDGRLVADAQKAIEHLLSLIRYVMNSDGEIPRCTEATRTYLRQHLDF